MSLGQMSCVATLVIAPAAAVQRRAAVCRRCSAARSRRCGCRRPCRRCRAKVSAGAVERLDEVRDVALLPVGGGARAVAARQPRLASCRGSRARSRSRRRPSRGCRARSAAPSAATMPPWLWPMIAILPARPRVHRADRVDDVLAVDLDVAGGVVGQVDPRTRGCRACPAPARRSSDQLSCAVAPVPCTSSTGARAARSTPGRALSAAASLACGTDRAGPGVSGGAKVAAPAGAHASAHRAAARPRIVVVLKSIPRRARMLRRFRGLARRHQGQQLVHRRARSPAVRTSMSDGCRSRR